MMGGDSDGVMKGGEGLLGTKAGSNGGHIMATPFYDAPYMMPLI